MFTRIRKRPKQKTETKIYLKRNTLFTAQDVDIVVENEWDVHGNVRPFPNVKGEYQEKFHADTVEVVDETFYFNHPNKEPVPIQNWILYVNGEAKDYNVISFRMRGKLYIENLLGTD